MPLDYREAVDGIAPTRSGFAMEGGRATADYYLPAAELQDAVTEILGSTRISEASTGRLERSLPKAHPQFPWLYASSVQVQGIGDKDPETEAVGSRVDAEDNLEVSPITDTYWQYVKYRLTVEFTPRPYALLKDDVIASYEIAWNDPADGSNKNTTVYPEWWRYTDWPYEPAAEVAHAQHGQMKFKTSGAAPDGVTFPGFPRVVLPKTGVRFQWFQVPISYLESAVATLVKYIGYINQLEWFGWDPGELLYLGPRVLRRYTPPVPQRETWLGTTTFSTEKLVDLELLFEETVRTVGSAVTPTPAWKIAKGHNIEPWIHDGKFYYVETTQTTASDRQPKFKSIPFEFLFQNPATL